MRRGFIIAIDGPAGSGKSTTARLVARKLGFCHLDTGAMYRAITLKAISTQTDITDSRQLNRLLATTTVQLDWQNGKVRVRLDGRDVSAAIREPQVNALVSDVAAIPAVRQRLVAQQRQIARDRNIVCEGRDIGSVVFPKAQLKIFLVCDDATRAERRRQELAAQGRKLSLTTVLANLRQRDRIDSGRQHSPLVRTPDAVLIDTTRLSIPEQVAIVCGLARKRMAS